MSNLNEYVANLANADEIERAFAAEDLGYLNAPEAVAPLLDRLTVEPSAVVRDAIFQALIRIENDAVIVGAISLLGSDHPQIRNMAVNLLHRKGNQSLPFLKQAMQAGDRDTRKFVLDALRGLLSSCAEDIYSAALADDDTNVVITAVENLGNLRATAFRAQIENLIQADAHPMLIAACLEALAGIGNESSLAVIQKQFPNLAELPSFSLTPCLRAIGSLGGEKEFEQVMALLPARTPQLYPAILGTLIQLYERGIYAQSQPPQPSETCAGRSAHPCREQRAAPLPLSRRARPRFLV